MPPTTDYDVAVIGAGYAGQLALREFAEAGWGHRVIAFDSRGRAGFPPQSTSGIAGRWLRELGLTLGPSAVAARIVSFRVYAPDGHSVRLQPPDSLRSDALGAVLVEPEFLGRMEKESVRRGVTVVHKVLVDSAWRENGGYRLRIREGEHRRTVSARWVLAADGWNSLVGRELGISTKLHPEDLHGGYERTVSMPASYPEGEVRIYLGPIAPGGYAWVFPSSEQGNPALRVGLGTPHSVRLPPIVWYRKWLEQHPEFQDPHPYHVVGGQIPTGPPCAQLDDGRGAMVLGDAARVCDSITGGGLYPAMYSGRWAARAVIQGDLRTYRQAMMPLLSELRIRYLLKQLVFGLSYRELNQLVDVIGSYPLASGEDLNPFEERRSLTRYLMATRPNLVATPLTRGRLKKTLQVLFDWLVGHGKGI